MSEVQILSPRPFFIPFPYSKIGAFCKSALFALTNNCVILHQKGGGQGGGQSGGRASVAHSAKSSRKWRARVLTMAWRQFFSNFFLRWGRIASALRARAHARMRNARELWRPATNLPPKWAYCTANLPLIDIAEALCYTANQLDSPVIHPRKRRHL